MTNEPEQMLRTLTRRFAGTPLTSDQIEPMRDALISSPFETVGINICDKGICIDHIWTGGVDKLDLTPLLDERLGDFLGCEVFPLGTILPDRARLRSQHSL